MIRIMESYGYLGIFFLIFVENVFPPIPSEVVLLFGGAMTAHTSLSVPMAEIATSLNLGIKPILYSFLYGLDQFFLPYELAPALIMFATGYVRVRYLIGIMLTRMVLASLIVAFVATFIWPMMNL